MNKTKKVKRICFVCGHPKYAVGGAENQLFMIGEELLKYGWEVHYVTFDYGQDDDETVDGMVLHKIHDKYKNVKGIRAITGKTAVYNALSRAGADIYLLRGISPLAAYVALYVRMNHRKFIYNIASIDDCTFSGMVWNKISWLDRRLYKYGLKKADCIIAIAHYLKDAMRKKTSKDIHVILSGHRIPIKIGENKTKVPVILYVGRLIDLKRPFIFVELAKKLPDAKFVMCGSGEMLHIIKEEANSINNLEVLGFIEPEKVNEYYKIATVFVNTSCTEGFPNTFIQAWLYGTPVVTLEIDPDEIVCRNKLGFHSKTRERLFEDVSRIINDEELRKELGMNCMKYAKENHNIEKTAEMYNELFEKNIKEIIKK